MKDRNRIRKLLYEIFLKLRLVLDLGTFFYLQFGWLTSKLSWCCSCYGFLTRNCIRIRSITMNRDGGTYLLGHNFDRQEHSWKKKWEIPVVCKPTSKSGWSISAPTSTQLDIIWMSIDKTNMPLFFFVISMMNICLLFWEGVGFSWRILLHSLLLVTEVNLYHWR